MAIIYTYPSAGLKGSDAFLISDGSDNKTYKLNADALLSWIDDNLQYDLQQVLNAGSEADLNTGSWTDIKIWRNKFNVNGYLLYLNPSITASKPSGTLEVYTTLEMKKGLATEANIESPSGETLKITSGKDLDINAEKIIHSADDFAASYSSSFEENLSTGNYSTQVQSGNYTVTTNEGLQSYVGTAGPGNTAFEFKALSTFQNPPYLHLKDNINLYLQSKVTDSLGDIGTDGKILKSDANGYVKWADDEVNVPGGSINTIQFHNSSGEFDGDDAFIYEKTTATSSKVTLGVSANHAGDLHLHSDGDNGIQAAINMFDTASQSLTIKAPLVYTTDYELFLPVDEPTLAASYLVSNASGEMSWAAGAGAAGIDGTVQLSDGLGNLISSTYLNYNDPANTLNVGIGNTSNSPACGLVIGSSTAKSGTLSVLGSNGGKVQFQSSANASVELTFPDATPTANQILESDASGQLSWINTPAGAASGNQYEVQFRGQNAGEFTTDSTFRYDTTTMSLYVGEASGLNADAHSVIIGASESKNGKLDIYSQNDHKVSLSTAVATTSDLVLRFPPDTPTAGQVLQSDGSGNLSWTANSATAAAAGSTGDVQFNNGSNQMTTASSGSSFNWIDNKGSLALSSIQGSNAALAAVSNSDTSTQSFTANLGVANFDNQNAGGSGTAAFSTVMALKSDNQTQATNNDQEFITFYNNNTQSALGSIIYDGTTSSMAFVSPSDERLKKDKADYDKSDAGSKIKALKVKKYKFIDGNDEEVKGFFAQQVKQVIPEAVIGEETDKWEDGSDKPLRINHVAFIPYLTAALQEAQDTIDKLNEQLTKLEKAVEDSNTIASDAKDKADEADSKATEAKEAAEKADEKATEAKSTAETAKEKADTNETEIAKKADKSEEEE